MLNFYRISDISMDIAEDRNTGLGRAFEVEQCQCPVGYRGLSCEVNFSHPKVFMAIIQKV